MQAKAKIWWFPHLLLLELAKMVLKKEGWAGLYPASLLYRIYKWSRWGKAWKTQHRGYLKVTSNLLLVRIISKISIFDPVRQHLATQSEWTALLHTDWIPLEEKHLRVMAFGLPRGQVKPFQRIKLYGKRWKRITFASDAVWLVAAECEANTLWPVVVWPATTGGKWQTWGTFQAAGTCLVASLRHLQLEASMLMLPATCTRSWHCELSPKTGLNSPHFGNPPPTQFYLPPAPEILPFLSCLHYPTQLHPAPPPPNPGDPSFPPQITGAAHANSYCCLLCPILPPPHNQGSLPPTPMKRWLKYFAHFSWRTKSYQVHFECLTHK